MSDTDFQRWIEANEHLVLHCLMSTEPDEVESRLRELYRLASGRNERVLQ